MSIQFVSEIKVQAVVRTMRMMGYELIDEKVGSYLFGNGRKEVLLLVQREISNKQDYLESL